MPTIKLTIEINAPIELVFDLSRSVDLHKLSTAKTNEEAVAGVTTGLMNLNDVVTWRAKHFGIYQKLTSKITTFERPAYFVDEMVSGIFSSFRHEHFFESLNSKTRVTDIFTYKSPLGFLGKIADKLFLENYMREFLKERNQIIKEVAESERAKHFLSQ